MISRIAGRVRDERGQALVEFALIFTMLVVLLFGVAEFGRGWFYANALSNGARDGARYASLQPKAGFETNVEDYTFRQMSSSVPKPATKLYVNVSAYRKDGNAITSFDNLSSGYSVTVIARYDMDIVTGHIIPSFSDTKTIVRKATMRYEGK
jgi:Flp pilus assembly protein TadG